MDLFVDTDGENSELIFFNKNLNGFTTYRSHNYFWLGTTTNKSETEYYFKTGMEEIHYVVLSSPFCDKEDGCNKKGFFTTYDPINGYHLAITTDTNAPLLAFKLEKIPNRFGILTNCYTTIVGGFKYTLMYHEKFKRLVIKEISTPEDLKYIKIGFATSEMMMYFFLRATGMPEFKNLVWFDEKEQKILHIN